MCRRRSCRHFLLLLLLLATSISLAAGQDEEAEIEEAEEEIQEDIEAVEAHSEETTTAEVAAEPEGELTTETCEFPTESVKSKCCKMMLDIDDKFIKCFMLHQKKMPKPSNQNPIVLVKYFSCLIECVYKSKKYMTKDDQINMNMVKADAKKTYKNDQKKQDYMIAQYEHCERAGGLEWSKLKKNPAAKALFKGACKPYYMFVFLCVIDYGKISCPHYQWNGTKELKKECEALKEKCDAIVG